MTNSRPIFVDVALDPTLVKGIYDTCDQWCMYCPATARCLAYRCDANIRSGKQDIYRSLADRLYEGMMFMKRLCEAEGRATPEIDAMLADDPRTRPFQNEVDDPLEKMGGRYQRLSDAYLLSRADFPFEMHPRPAGPTPYEAFAWYHALVPAKIYRALLAAQKAARADAHVRNEALASAKVALIGIDRSIDALAAMETEDDDPRLELMRNHLRRLRREMDGRFPDARAFVRRGLDDIAIPASAGRTAAE
jgi:hypothetical protein